MDNDILYLNNINQGRYKVCRNDRTEENFYCCILYYWKHSLLNDFSERKPCKIISQFSCRIIKAQLPDLEQGYGRTHESSVVNRRPCRKAEVEEMLDDVIVRQAVMFPRKSR